MSRDERSLHCVALRGSGTSRSGRLRCRSATSPSRGRDFSTSGRYYWCNNLILASKYCSKVRLVVKFFFVVWKKISPPTPLQTDSLFPEILRQIRRRRSRLEKYHITRSSPQRQSRGCHPCRLRIQTETPIFQC